LVFSVATISPWVVPRVAARRSRRNKSRRLSPVGGHIDSSAFGTQHSAYAIEGRIEGIGQLARGANRASRAQWRFVSRLFFAMVGAFLALAAVIWLVGHFA
jgi:hypothetical protein